MRPAEITIVYEELELSWGKDLVEEIRVDAIAIRKAAWEAAKERTPGLQEICFEPSPELMLAVAIRKLFKVSMYNRGTFPQIVATVD